MMVIDRLNVRARGFSARELPPELEVLSSVYVCVYVCVCVCVCECA